MFPTVYIVDRDANVGHIRKVFNGEHVTWCGEHYGPHLQDVRRYSTTELLAEVRPVCRACAAARDAAEAAEPNPEAEAAELRTPTDPYLFDHARTCRCPFCTGEPD